MGRFHHLERTLPINLINASSYPNCEFIILNYNSNDGIHEWIKQNLKNWLESGLVKYFRTQQPKYFIPAHAKNIAHRQATGDILCNLDADNFVVPGYPEYLNDLFQKEDYVVGSSSLDIFDFNGGYGKIAIKRQHFYNVGGYNEDLNLGWSWEDADFRQRVLLYNNLQYHEADRRFCRLIDHSNKERVENFIIKDIKKTQNIGELVIKKTLQQKNYIANKNRIWGFVSDLSSDI